MLGKYALLSEVPENTERKFHMSENFAALFGNLAEGVSFVLKEQTVRKITWVQLF